MPSALPISLSHFRPGDRVSVAVSGGADSVALLCALRSVAGEQGLVLRVAHFHHGLRGAEADEDAAFVGDLAARLGVAVDTRSAATTQYATEKRLSIESAARELRYAFFRDLLRTGAANVVGTAHTQNDQAETVLLKLMRGAWTEGLGGISPELPEEGGKIVRPLLQTSRAEVETYLKAIGQPWREDSSNQSSEFTRNRVRAELLPLLESFNPNIVGQLQRVSEIARQEESYWQAEVERVLPNVLLPGKPVRGGGRRVSTAAELDCVALDLAKFGALPVALQRRLLRAAAEKLGFRLEFDAVTLVLGLIEKRPGARATLPRGLQVARTARELHLEIDS